MEKQKLLAIAEAIRTGFWNSDILAQWEFEIIISAVNQCVARVEREIKRAKLPSILDSPTRSSIC
jgi:hypothetical protein